MSRLNVPSILLISVDAVRYELALNPTKYGIKLPNIQRFIEEGAYSDKGVTPVFPSLTYCCHQSIITGTTPSKHQIYSNKYFDPIGKYMDSWYWYVSENVPTLWSYAKNNGYFTVNIGFPTSVLAEADLNIPEFWRDTTELDSKVLDAVSVPQGLVSEVEEAAGRIRCGLWDIEDDHTKLKACMWVLDEKVKPNLMGKPFFMTTYFASYDDIAHHEGTFGKKSLEYLQKTDEYIGKLVDKAMEVTDGNLIICVVSDHGMIDNVADVNPNKIFKDNGLIQVGEKGDIVDWQVWAQRGGGVANIKLKNPLDNKIYEKTKAILENLAKEYPKAIDQVMTGKESHERRKGYSDSDFIMTTKPGYEVREDLEGAFITELPSQKSQHGYNEDLNEMKSMFFIKGKGIGRGLKLGSFSLIDIAPTLSSLMGIKMDMAEGKNVLIKKEVL